MSGGGYYLPLGPVAGRRVVAGLDLGRRRTPACLAIVEARQADWEFDYVRRTYVPPAAGEVTTLVHLHWFPLRTDFLPLVAECTELVTRAEVGELWVDGTGLGAPVVELFDAAMRGRMTAVRPAMITAGESARAGEDGWEHVARPVLLSRLAVELECGRLRAAAGLTGWDRLKAELRGIGVDGRRRGGVRDDGVIALALAAYGVCRRRGVAGKVGERDSGRLV